MSQLSSVAAPPPARDALRVASFNLWGRFGDWPTRLALLAEAWPAVGADILVLQEVIHDRGGEQAREVAQRLGFPYMACSLAHRSAFGGAEGVAVVSHRLLSNVISQPLAPSNPERCMLTVEVMLEQKPLMIVNAHTVFHPEYLAHEQIAEVFSPAGRPIVIGGDLNVVPEDIAGLIHEAGLRDDLSQIPATWPVDPKFFAEAWSRKTGRKPSFSLEPRRLDYLLSAGLEVLAVGALPVGDPQRGYASDHALAWADYRLPQPPAPPPPPQAKPVVSQEPIRFEGEQVEGGVQLRIA